jgi:hypothetical protein
MSLNEISKTFPLVSVPKIANESPAHIFVGANIEGMTDDGRISFPARQLIRLVFPLLKGPATSTVSGCFILKYNSELLHAQLLKIGIDSSIFVSV